MAQRKTTSTNRSNQRSGSSAKKAPASSRSSKSAKKPVVYEEEKEPLYSVIWSYSWGKALYLLLGILVMIGLDFLIAMNHYDLFFTVLGIEIIAAMLIGWIVFIVLDRIKQKELDSEMQDNDPEE